MTSDSEAESRNRVKRSKLEILVGGLLALLGLVAIARPTYATIASTVVFGWIFMLAGLDLLVYAVRSPRGQLIWRLLLGLLCLGAGILVLSNVFKGALALTLLLGITIFLIGVVQVILAFWIRPATRWAWVLLSGLLGIMVGIFIWSAWPLRADWIIGFWIGVSFIGQGIWMMGLAVPHR